jgi:hypothetical protein
MPKDILERRGGLICRSDLELHKVRLFRVAFGTSHWDMSNVNLLRYRDNEERESQSTATTTTDLLSCRHSSKPLYRPTRRPPPCASSASASRSKVSGGAYTEYAAEGMAYLLVDMPFVRASGADPACAVSALTG